MTRSQTVKKISHELAEALDCHDKINVITSYISMTIVTELERQNQKVYIYEMLDKKSGLVLAEFWGLTEVAEYLQKRKRSIERNILLVAAGKRNSAYGYKWKKL